MKLVTVLVNNITVDNINTYFGNSAEGTHVDIDLDTIRKDNMLDYAKVASHLADEMSTKDAPAFHKETHLFWKTKDAEMRGMMTSSANVFVVGHYDESCLIIAYEGTRARFLEEVRKLESTFPGIKDEINSMAPDVYETSGPADMLPAECQADYLIRVGGTALLKEVSQCMEKLDPNGTNFTFGSFTPWGETSESHGYNYDTSYLLTCNENTVLGYWFNAVRGDSKHHLRLERIDAAKIYLATKQASAIVLDKMLGLV